MTPQPGVAPLIAGNAQSEVTCSTIDELPDHSLKAPLASAENASSAPPGAHAEFAPALKPTPEQQLDFLNYLVKRGLVNEGFTEGRVPQQYRHTH